MSTTAARFGKAGTKIHLAASFEEKGRVRLASSTPLCGTYTRPGSGWAMPGTEVTCGKCLAAAAGQ